MITGGAGFIGSAIIDRLKKNDFEIFVFDNLSFGNRKFANVDDAHFIQGDLLDRKILDQWLERIQPSIIIHLAAIHFIPFCNENPIQAADSNILGTINLLRAARRLQKLEKLFFASTAAVYPVSDHAHKESDEPGPMDIYGLTKLAGESVVREFYYDTKVPSIICRFFNAFGPNETNPHLIPVIQEQLNSGERNIKLGNLEPKRDFIHTYDMAAAVEKLLVKFNDGCDIFNLGSGQEFSVLEIVQAFERQLGEPVNIVVDESRKRKVERMHLLADISKLKAFIDWQPRISIDEGVKTLILKKQQIETS